MSNLNGRICVFTGSRHGQLPEYADAAKTLGSELVTRGYGLVYGGGNVGLMKAIANSSRKEELLKKALANRERTSAKRHPYAARWQARASGKISFAGGRGGGLCQESSDPVDVWSGNG